GEQPEIVRAIHDEYLAAGADVLTTNTYNIHRDRFVRDGVEDEFERLNRLGCRLAVEARDAHGEGLVAGGIGPLVGSYRPDAGNDPDVAAPAFEEIAVMQADYVDLFLLETMSSIAAARGAVMGASVPGKPVWLAITVRDDDGSVLRSGEPVEEALALVEELSVAALLVNCSRPEAVSVAVSRLSGAGAPTGAYANGFTRITEDFQGGRPEITMLEERVDLDPDAYAVFGEAWAKDGATIIGGCCEVGPAHIAELSRRFKE
ncbi:MAG: homocysteine S-methyltransferase family protein, partial [Pseudomonadota bacterium]